MEFYATCTPNELARPQHHHIPADAALLLPASAFRRDWKKFRIPHIPPQVATLAADCGGFVATFKWGCYRYGAAEYVDWLNSWARWPQWAATMDYCCEDEITSGKSGIVRERQSKTTEMAYHFWNTYRDCGWQWTPTIQGWDASDYEQHAAELAPLIAEMKAHYGNDFRVGIGTLCRRASVEQIREVVRAVADVLPDTNFHLWGIKLGAIQAGLPISVISVDSAAWHGLFGRTMRDWKPTGMKKNEYAWRVGYANYVGKVYQPHQIPLL